MLKYLTLLAYLPTAAKLIEALVDTVKRIDPADPKKFVRNAVAFLADDEAVAAARAVMKRKGELEE